MNYDDPSKPGYDPTRTTGDSLSLGGLVALVAIFALLFLGIYFFSPRDGTRTAENSATRSIPTAPEPSPGPGK